MSASPEAPIPRAGVAGFDRNQRQLSIGISGNLRLESVAGFDRNRWEPSRGIRKPSLRVLMPHVGTTVPNPRSFMPWSGASRGGAVSIYSTVARLKGFMDG